MRITQLDGKLPNLALMRLAAFHRARGDDIHFTRSARRGMFEPDYTHVYGSTIFKFSADRVERMRVEFPDAVIGGTGSGSVAMGRREIGESIARPLGMVPVTVCISTKLADNVFRDNLHS